MLIKLQVVAVINLESCNNRDSLEINCDVNEGRQSDTYPLNLKGEIMSEFKGWEEVPDEDLWEDGELSTSDVKHKIWTMLHYGKYKLIRRKS